MSEKSFHPLATEHLAQSIGLAFLNQPLQPLPPPEVDQGAGIYAIYYFGRHKYYRTLSKHNNQSRLPLPLYVGKAMPKGTRLGISEDDIGHRIRGRLINHSNRIQETDLALADCRCRYLLLDPVFVPLGESLLIGLFEPAWNLVASGFGNNAVGGGRAAQRRSLWDSLHPGREWSSKLAPDVEQKIEGVKKNMREHFKRLVNEVAPELVLRFSGPLVNEKDQFS